MGVPALKAQGHRSSWAGQRGAGNGYKSQPVAPSSPPGLAQARPPGGFVRSQSVSPCVLGTVPAAMASPLPAAAAAWRGCSLCRSCRVQAVRRHPEMKAMKAEARGLDGSQALEAASRSPVSSRSRLASRAATSGLGTRHDFKVAWRLRVSKTHSPKKAHSKRETSASAER